MSSSGPADVIFSGGGVYTVDTTRPWARAVAVRQGRIVAIGSDDDVLPLAGAGTRHVDLRGRMLLPGFHDAHIHAPSGGLDRLRLDLSSHQSMDGYQRGIASYAESHPRADWVLGGGWLMSLVAGGNPTRQELDAVVDDRPAFITDVNNHAGWVNTRALEVAGVDRDTPDPPDGRIVRDERGNPAGTLLEGAMDLVRRHAPPTNAQLRKQGLLNAQAYLHSLGITGWQDAIVGTYSTIEDNFDCYVAASDDATLTARVMGALWFQREGGLDQLPALLERKDGAAGRFRADTVKVMVDGSSENHSAAMIEPYLPVDGSPEDNIGIVFFETSELREIFLALDGAGFNLHVHVLGDRACRMTLDAFEALAAFEGPRHRRHHLAHLQFVQPADLPRIGKLGLIANVQPQWAVHGPVMDVATIPFLGERRASWQYRFASMAKTGAMLAFGSDWPVSSPNPLWGIHVAVNRTPPAGTGAHGAGSTDPFLPDERIDRRAAIHAYTMGSAYVNHLDGQVGSIEVGKLADLVVLDRNIFEHPSAEIGGAQVLLTMVDGVSVFASRDI